jgi:uncharacterized membrane protein (DUF485 family)
LEIRTSATWVTLVGMALLLWRFVMTGKPAFFATVDKYTRRIGDDGAKEP